MASTVKIVLEEANVDFRNAGSTTFRKEDQERGFEPDSSVYIRNVDRVRCKKKLDMSTDPPPDLLIEVDLTSDSLDKFPLYALAVPEVWRYKDSLEIFVLDNGEHVQRSSSVALPMLTAELVTAWVKSSLTEKRPTWLGQVRRAVRSAL